jgi:CelD/BcsL family acetyltransferase involved in cellulose biosynthesis
MAGIVDGRHVSSAGIRVTVTEVSDFGALEAKWRDLENRSSLSFFQSWTWTGCLIEERFPDPVLAEARDGERTVALALFNRRGRSLFLGESGNPALDCPYIEFNGILAERGREEALSLACLRAVHGTGFWRRRLVLAGVDTVTARVASQVGSVHTVRSVASPWVDVSLKNPCFLTRRSANTRQQLRRSHRDYASVGDIVSRCAEDPAEASRFLDELITLHQASWRARGEAGAFARPFFGRFHRALIERGMPRGEIALVRVSAGAQVIGYLYNFRYRGRSLAYQSGFDYAGASRSGKPGLTCHYEAIRLTAGWGGIRYDFLAGNDRYKRSLSDRQEMLHWIEIMDGYSPRFVLRRALSVVRVLARSTLPRSLRAI